MNPILAILGYKCGLPHFLPMSVMMGDGNTFIGLDVVGNVAWGSVVCSFVCCSDLESCQYKLQNLTAS